MDFSTALHFHLQILENALTDHSRVQAPTGFIHTVYLTGELYINAS